MAKSKGSVKVEGVAEVTRAFATMERSAADMTDTHRRVVSGLLPGIAGRTPVRSGALAGSWSAGATKKAGRVLSPLVYAGPIEWGWPEHNIIGAAMVRATIEAERDTIVQTYEAELEAAGKRAGFGTDG